MKAIIKFSVVVLVALVSCNGHTRKNISYNTSDTAKPKTNIKVKKDYDDKGNLIGYDSAYSSYYSNIKGDTALRDSIFNNFKNKFNESYFFSGEPYFKDFFFADSLLKYDFYKKDFFYNRFRNNMQRMDSLFRGMDKMKNDFFSRQNRIGSADKSKK